eukprot:156631_1
MRYTQWVNERLDSFNRCCKSKIIKPDTNPIIICLCSLYIFHIYYLLQTIVNVDNLDLFFINIRTQIMQTLIFCLSMLLKLSEFNTTCIQWISSKSERKYLQIFALHSKIMNLYNNNNKKIYSVLILYIKISSIILSTISFWRISIQYLCIMSLTATFWMMQLRIRMSQKNEYFQNVNIITLQEKESELVIIYNELIFKVLKKCLIPTFPQEIVHLVHEYSMENTMDILSVDLCRKNANNKYEKFKNINLEWISSGYDHRIISSGYDHITYIEIFSWKLLKFLFFLKQKMT